MSEVGKIAKGINDKAKKGEHIALYLDGYLSKVSKSVPSIVKGELTLVTGSTGSGKTQFTKSMFLNFPLEYMEENNVDLKIIYLCLEETEIEFKQKMTIRFLHQIYEEEIGRECDISYSHLNGSRRRINPEGSDGYFTEQELELIDKCANKVDKLLENVYLITDIGTPTSLYKKCENLAKEWGTYEYKDEIIEYEDPFTGDTIRKKERLLDYTPGSNNEHVIVITDHMSLILQEKDPITKHMLSERETISKWNTYYCRAIFCKKFNWSVVNVIQQNFDTDKLEVSSFGEKLIEKAKPSLGNIGNSRESARDAHNVIGIFNPNKFKVSEYRGYDISRFGDTFRVWMLLKNRNGPANIEIPLFFDGMNQHFEELPKTDDALLESDYYPRAKIVNDRFLKQKTSVDE